jgi:hypothetical protein
MVAIVWLVRRGLLPVVPAKGGTHIPEAVVMGPRFRGDDNTSTHISMSSATSRWGAEWVIHPEEA